MTSIGLIFNLHHSKFGGCINFLRSECLAIEMISLSKQRPGQKDKLCTSIHRQLQLPGNPDDLDQETEHTLCQKPALKFMLYSNTSYTLRLSYTCVHRSSTTFTNHLYKLLEKSTGPEESLSAERTM